MSAHALRATPARWYWSIVAFRALWASTFVFFVNAAMPLGTTPWLVSLSGGLGVLTASRLAHSRLRSAGFAAGLATLCLLISVVFWAGAATFPSLGSRYFSFDSIQIHTNTCLIAFSLSAVLTWIFWRARGAVTFEALALATVCILIFAGHRNFHLDRPKIINSIAWRMGVDHLTMLIVIGSALLGASVLYLFLASQARRPALETGTIHRSSNGPNIFLSTIFLALVAALIYWIQALLYSHFNAMMLARVANGVGMGSESGVSPLTFQSALGSTNQPAGLVRLEGDYADNPFSPMMYMRESALSAFSGREMVFAGKAYDTDLPLSRPTEAFTGKEDADLGAGVRTPLVQSVFLLADHEHVFAVDYPVSIVQLKNPKPNRFKATYRAYSIAPAFKMSEAATAEVGDPRWTQEVREHYLKGHADPRYEALAREITAGVAKPVEKMTAITNHLSRTAIYTLTPNHQVEPDEDPVAPFLFGDHRGYCVHFAHAIVYMARSIGVPARVATGYLTDLSQAKDGHILLRMSDRHAWAEIFITGYGWVPFDVQPDQVESHADTQVDSKLLEELMGMLEPGEEILPSDQTKDEPGMMDPDEIWTPDAKMFEELGKIIARVIILVFLLSHFLLFAAWVFVRSPDRRLRLGYRAMAARLHNLGLSRRFGETRSDFASRLPHEVLAPLTPLILSRAYAGRSSAPLSRDQVDGALKQANQAFSSFPRWKRILSLLNPSAIFRFIGGGRW